MAADNSTAPAETWKPIPEFEGYEASDLGRIRSWWERRHRSNGYKGEIYYEIGSAWHLLKPKPDDRGRLRLNLRHESGRIRTVMVAHAVLTAFVGPRPPKMQACHFPDADVTNNRLGNLRWDTPKENTRDAGRHGTKKILLSDQLCEIDRLAREGFTMSEIASRLGVRISAICRAIRREGLSKTRRPPSEKRLPEAKIEEMRRLRQEGFSDRRIAAMLGMSKANLWRRLGPKSPANLT